MAKNNFTPFDVHSIPLEGKNLVEASAGTGKTFSIGLLTLRLLLEKGFDLKKILLVTFTNAATAELEGRIRSFVQMANDYAAGGNIDEEQIKTVVKNSNKRIGDSQTKERLKDALLFLDELSIMTIHGFCMQSLTNHAFPSGQLFGSQLVTSNEDILTRFVQQFWREHITTLPIPLLEILLEKKLSLEKIQSILKEHLAGKRYYAYDPKKKYRLDKNFLAAPVKAIDEAYHKKENSLEDFSKKIKEGDFDLEECFGRRKHAARYITMIHDHERLIKEIAANRDKNYMDPCLKETGLLPIVDEYLKADTEQQLVAESLLPEIYGYAIQAISGQIEDHLLANGILSFDQLIKNLHTALCGPSREALAKALQQEYDAVFIDEFQDTDRYQYEIFNTAFGKSGVIFYIGDPKQSIYAFRQADINTYFKAAADVDNRYSMNTNFRSSTKMIEALNRFFLPVESFDTFHFSNGSDSIPYTRVDPPNDKPSGRFVKNGKEAEPITIFKMEKDKVSEQTALMVYDLLTSKEYQIQTTEGTRSIVPTDIGILVKGNDYGKEIRNQLSFHNIPAVLFTDQKIMESDQASELYFLLQAIYDPTIERINTALLSTLTGYQNEDILKLDHELILNLFKNYNTIWQSQGVYSCIASFKKDFAIQSFLTDPKTENGLRIISNLSQLTEILFQKEYHQKLKPAELLDWLKRAMQTELLEEDQSLLRLENDEDAVRISTIHKSKGLEYKIVILPEFDFVPNLKSKKSVSFYRDGEYVNMPVSALDAESKEIYFEQQEQEHRRLMYVAATRAVYKTFIYKKESDYYDKSGFAKIIEALNQNEGLNKGLINFDQELLPSHRHIYSPATPNKAVKKNNRAFISLRDTNWRFLSYSSLSVFHNDILITDEPVDTGKRSDYDQFIFKDLMKGPVTGNMLHEIFEAINFSKEERQNKKVKYIIDRYGGRNKEQYQKWIPLLIDHVLDSQLIAAEETFSLADIKPEAKLNELEFDYTLTDLQPETLASIAASYDIPVRLQDLKQVKGLMNGFIDLLFEHNGKYYLLDWKSNFLGADESYYSPQHTANAMELYNYHLQYLIYSVALKRFLTNTFGRFDESLFGGVFYCFIRGMRANQSTGIFYNRPSMDLINQLDNAMLGNPVSP